MPYRSMSRASVLATAVLVVTSAVIAANAQSPPATSTVTLHCGLPVPLNSAAIPAIRSWALQLISSSDGNSQAPDWSFPLSEVNQEYREAVSGDYLRVDFASRTTIKTRHGVVHAGAIVLGLDPAAPNWRAKYPDHFDDSLLTLDADGTVVGHALYSGLDAFAVARAIKRGIADPAACERAKAVFVKDSQLPAFIRDFFRQNDLLDPS